MAAVRAAEAVAPVESVWPERARRGLAEALGVPVCASPATAVASSDRAVERGSFRESFRGFRRESGKVLRGVEEGQLLFALLENVDGADEAGLMKQYPGSVKEEPDDCHVNDEGDVDGLAKASLGALVIEGVEKMNQFMLFEFAVAAGAHLNGRIGGCGVGRRLEGGHGL